MRGPAAGLYESACGELRRVGARGSRWRGRRAGQARGRERSKQRFRGFRTYDFRIYGGRVCRYTYGVCRDARRVTCNLRSSRRKPTDGVRINPALAVEDAGYFQ